MLQSLIKSGVVVVVASLWSMVASAGTITCGNQYRTATLTSAELCGIGSGNTKESDIESYFGGDWVHLGGIAGSDGTAGTLVNGYLTLTLLNGVWGSPGPISGTWAIDSSFWTVYGKAALSIHVGNGKYDPDHFAWYISEGNTSGTWSYQHMPKGGGGGLSNMHLWGSGEPAVQVSEPNLALLLILGLLSMFVARRRV
ncbi:hypothetical protein [Cellvibrio fontiphilus]|uniref:PEP-CTERM protein-sorting domain-containing protein n=1 Tax=Cellvibrio fontiphilus TaxID=1815559 RepID=A0ABV7FKZ8_9GAMM